jgi:hypothetical protein
MAQTKPFCRVAIRMVAVVELFIGSMTILGLIFYPAFFTSRKPSSVFIFVMVSSVISSVLGYGIFRLREWARRLLVFFSGYIIFTKILVFMGLIHFTGEILTVPAPWIKDCVSLSYHALLIVLLENGAVKELFKKGGRGI